MNPAPAVDSTRKVYRLGTHRSVEPRATLERVRPHLPAMGITRIANVTGLDCTGFPVATACRPNARSLAVSQGKGLDLDSAKASAVMESIEAFHAEHIHAPLRFGSVTELARHWPLADVSAMPLSEAGRFDEHLDLFWIEGRNWLNDAALWVPLEAVSVDFTLPLPRGSGCFAATSNGLASGNVHLEAVCHGICEVVERDAVTLWKLRGETARKATVLDPQTIDDALCVEALQRFQRAGLQVAVWDVTSDVGIATFCCLVYGAEQDWADPEFGAGCHPAREVALLRALTEAAQARTTFISGSRDDLGSSLYEPSVRRRRRRHCLGLIGDRSAGRHFQQAPTLDSDSFEIDVQWMLDRLRSVGITEVIVVDLARPEFGLPVVRVVIPGLEGPFGHEQGDFVAGRRARAVMPF